MNINENEMADLLRDWNQAKQRIAELERERDELRGQVTAVKTAGIHIEAQLLAQNARLREALRHIWDADEMGYLTDGMTETCVQCGQTRRIGSVRTVQHTSECVEGWIEQALESPQQSLAALFEPTKQVLEALKLVYKDSSIWKHCGADLELQRIEELCK